MNTRISLVAACVAVAAVQPAGADELVRITRQDCLRLTRHQPAPDVAYQPGVDTRGRAVAPADLGGGAQLNLPAEIVIPLEVDLTARYGLPRREGLYEGKAQVGTVTVRDGTVLFNGQPMNEFDQHLVAQACRAMAGR